MVDFCAKKLLEIEKMRILQKKSKPVKGGLYGLLRNIMLTVCKFCTQATHGSHGTFFHAIIRCFRCAEDGESRVPRRPPGGAW